VEGLIKMSRKELFVLHEVRLCVEGSQCQMDAAAKLGRSVRQVKRMVRRYREEGEAGLCHRSRGRPSNRAYEEVVREEVLNLMRERLRGFGPALASEKVEEILGREIGPETLRRWMMAEGLWERHRKSRAHRRRRERKAHVGELVQMDGSFHDWLGTGEICCLMVMVDDATGRTLARLYAQETTQAALEMLGQWAQRYGLPSALYTDYKSVYLLDKETADRLKARGEAALTQFGRACERLGVRIIGASSPQAKGRVERKNGVFQDRFVKELKLRGIGTMEGANALLDGGYLDDLNRRFAKEAAEPGVDYHRPVPEGVNLIAELRTEEVRSVANDWTFRYGGRTYQITGPRGRVPPAKSKVRVQIWLDGSLHVVYRNWEVRAVLLPEGTRRKTEPGGRPAPPRPRRLGGWIPPPDHPWRKSFSPRAPSSGEPHATSRAGGSS
jgi:transposase